MDDSLKKVKIITIQDKVNSLTNERIKLDKKISYLNDHCPDEIKSEIIIKYISSSIYDSPDVRIDLNKEQKSKIIFDYLLNQLKQEQKNICDKINDLLKELYETTN